MSSKQPPFSAPGSFPPPQGFMNPGQNFGPGSAASPFAPPFAPPGAFPPPPPPSRSQIPGPYSAAEAPGYAVPGHPSSYAPAPPPPPPPKNAPSYQNQAGSTPTGFPGYAGAGYPVPGYSGAGYPGYPVAAAAPPTAGARPPFAPQGPSTAGTAPPVFTAPPRPRPFGAYPGAPMEPPTADQMNHGPSQQMNYGPSSQPGVPPFAKRPQAGGQWPSYPPDSYGQAGSAAPPQRIDPSQIPRPHASRTVGNYETSSVNLPPSATSDFVADDIGNCSPRIMRSSLYQVPCTGEMLTNAGMPLALMVQPLALPHPDEAPVRVVDCGEDGPVRCARCKAYMNPFTKFTEQGRRFLCSLCGHSNETPKHYYCNMGADGRRRDADERPELSRGTVEFVATKEFMLRPPMPPVYLFVIDVSANALKLGATAATCSAIKKVLSDFPEGSRTLVGVATFDSTIHFYDLNRKLQQPHMLVVPDIEDVFVPLETGLLVPVSEGVEHVEQLLENIPNLFFDNPVQSSCLGSAIKASFLALQRTGGKVLVFQSVLPTVGLCSLTPREAESRGPEKDAYKVLLPADKNLGAMIGGFTGSQVCVDLFLTAQAFLDMASLAVLPKTTGGQLYSYFPFSAAMDAAKLYNDLRWNLVRPQGLEAVMRVRCSQGLRIQEYSGSYAKRISDDLELPAIDCDKAMLVTFKYDDKFQEGALCCFQSALLYTTMNGERRIRVSTLALPCTSVFGNIFKGADLDTQFAHMLKTAAHNLTTMPLSQVREQTISHCVQSLYAYRKYIATASSSGQLILPECLKLLPLYTLALTKTIAFTQDARVDLRSYWLFRVASISASLAIPLVYPRLFAVHDLVETLGNEALPPALPLSSEQLHADGIFLLENGDDAYLYTGRAVSPELLYQLFGQEEKSGQFVLQEYDNEPSKLLNRVVNEIRQQRCSYLRLQLLKRDDPLETVFHSFMVEDRNVAGPSYVEFLVTVHKQIQQRMQSAS